MRNISILFLVLVFYGTTAFGQEALPDEPEQIGLRKNVVYGTVGFIPFYGAINANYERMLVTTSSKWLNTFWLRAGYGEWGGWAVGGSHGVLTAVVLTGERSSHFEASLGATYLYNRQHYELDLALHKQEPDIYPTAPKRMDETSFHPAGSMGYRYQKPGGYFVFRTGISFPETVYLSLGFSF